MCRRERTRSQLSGILKAAWSVKIAGACIDSNFRAGHPRSLNAFHLLLEMFVRRELSLWDEFNGGDAKRTLRITVCSGLVLEKAFGRAGIRHAKLKRSWPHR